MFHIVHLSDEPLLLAHQLGMMTGVGFMGDQDRQVDNSQGLVEIDLNTRPELTLVPVIGHPWLVRDELDNERFLLWQVELLTRPLSQRIGHVRQQRFNLVQRDFKRLLPLLQSVPQRAAWRKGLVQCLMRLFEIGFILPGRLHIIDRLDFLCQGYLVAAEEAQAHLHRRHLATQEVLTLPVQVAGL